MLASMSHHPTSCLRPGDPSGFTRAASSIQAVQFCLTAALIPPQGVVPTLQKNLTQLIILDVTVSSVQMKAK